MRKWSIRTLLEVDGKSTNLLKSDPFDQLKNKPPISFRFFPSPFWVEGEVTSIIFLTEEGDTQ